jgi:hypothetical protein
MNLVISVAVGLVMAAIAFFTLFGNWSDFCDGLYKFFHAPTRIDQQGNERLDPFASPDAGDEGGANGFRFFMWVLLSLGAGLLTYAKLHFKFR